MTGKPVRDIVIVGGGTAGWMAAAAFSNYFLPQHGIRITLVESSQIGTVGVGEATLPGIRDFHKALGLDEVEFIKKTQATFKLGIEFNDWRQQGSQFFHPFSGYGVNLNGIGFHHYLSRLRQQGQEESLASYSLPAAMAKLSRFAQPHPHPPHPIADYSYAFHFDAALYARYLRDYAVGKGVSLRDQRVTGVHLDHTNGFISSISLDNGEHISGDFFIDCTGFKGLLIEETLHTGYEDWSKWLFCNSAAAVQSSNVDPVPFTRTRALASGWQWTIPLQHRAGNGYVYSDKYISDEEAIQTLLGRIDGAPKTEPRTLKFTTGRRKKLWNKNCFAVGLAAGFLEPLESTSISMIQTALYRLLSFFPYHGIQESDVNEVNRLSINEAERIRDFLILHYAGSQRSDSKFWKDCSSMDIPDSLQNKLEVFKSRGHLLIAEGESFKDASWLTMYEGFGIEAKGYDLRADYVDGGQLSNELQKMKAAIKAAAESAVKHKDFINRHCASDQ